MCGTLNGTLRGLREALCHIHDMVQVLNIAADVSFRIVEFVMYNPGPEFWDTLTNIFFSKSSGFLRYMLIFEQCTE